MDTSGSEVVKSVENNVEWQVSVFTQTPHPGDGPTWTCSGVTKAALTTLPFQHAPKSTQQGQELELARIW